MKQLAAVLLLTVSFAVQAQSNGIDQKLKMVIPSLKISGVTVQQALMSIQRTSRDIDPDKKGVTIIIQEKNEKILNKKVTFDLTNIPIKDAIKYVCMGTGLHYRVNNSSNSVVVSSSLKGQVITKFYTVSSAFKGYVNPQNTRVLTQEKLKEFFATGGVTFPKGAQVSYIPGKNLLSISNTSTNQAKAKKLLMGLRCLR